MSVTLYEKIYQAILKDIKSGKLKEGDRIPTELELAEQFNVSRITSKKALGILSNARLIERHRGKGSYVAKVLPDLNQLELSEPQHEAPEPPSHDNWKLIGVILPDFTESFGSKLLRAIELKCAERHIRMILKLTHDSREEEEFSIRSLVKMGVDGLIILPVHGEHYNSELLRLVLDGFPLVLLDRYLKGIPACSVCTNNKKAAYELTQLLTDSGHSHIAFLSTPPENTSTIEDRILGYSEAMLHSGVGVEHQYINTALYSTLPNHQHEGHILKDQLMLRDFIDQHPQITAFVVCEYLLAVNLQKVIQEMQTTRTFEIVCFDSMEHPISSPLFSYVRQDEVTMGHQVVELLNKQWDNKEVPTLSIIEHSLVIKSNR
ncbi:GntR family transcriptional regulator [Paenibacillus guangzhouensis]|uniref:GntR family transcriptional regulator n=1 Tax=Paenibacillus guangzhouensis TaxID=1473112 RepID=UPI00187B4B33|nr:GntR family transcriptional regulator [Paenibacillus guangzhouensis]